MMRSLYSGVAGLKTHQTRMDVIGNNIANVNTVGFKSSSANFSDTFYQTVSSATGANAENGTAGTNAKQIGLGSTVASITTNITENGGTSSTNRALDIAINGEAFLVVSDGSQNLFTKSGALNVDEAGNLYCTTNGCIVQGWRVDPNDPTKIMKDTVKDLVVMSPEQMYSPPKATKAVTIAGNIDPTDPDNVATFDANGVPVSGGEVTTFSFYDNLGESYTVKMYISKSKTQDKPAANATSGTVTYDVRIADVLNSNSESIFVVKKGGVYSYSGAKISFGGATFPADANAVKVDSVTGEVTLTQTLPTTNNGNTTGGTIQQITFNSVNGDDAKTKAARDNANFNGKAINFSVIGPVPEHQGDDIVEGTLSGATSSFSQYDATSDSGGVEIYFSELTQYTKGGTTKIDASRGNPQKEDGGNKAGKMKGIAIDEEGKVWGSYDNGMKGLLGQIAVATFANPSGLEAMGDSLFAASLNSGEFDGVGEEVTLSGSMTVGALEMSNVDLASEFTTMIITQRGFQANSRIITTSDSMLEELVNLKR